MPRLRRFALSLAGNARDADDLVQAACEKALRNAAQFMPGSRMDSWMYRIVQTLRLDDRRRITRRGATVDPDDAHLSDEGKAASLPEDRLMLARTRAAMAELPEGQREVLALVVIEVLSYREVAETLDLPIGTVMSRLSRARGSAAETGLQPGETPVMPATTMDPARLAAFADGELSPEEAAAVVMHLADHPADQAWVDDLMAANAALARAFGAPMTEPVPPRILAAIEGAPAPTTVLPFRRRALPLRGLALGGLALAASVGLVALMLPAPGGPALALGPVEPGARLSAHLDALPSGQTVVLDGGAELTILASLPTAAGFCREVEVIDRPAARLDMGLACRDDAGWQVQVALSEPLPDAAAGQGHVPADGAETEALTPWLDRLGAGLALDAAAEAQAIARGWRP